MLSQSWYFCVQGTKRHHTNMACTVLAKVDVFEGAVYFYTRRYGRPVIKHLTCSNNSTCEITMQITDRGILNYIVHEHGSLLLYHR